MGKRIRKGAGYVGNRIIPEMGKEFSPQRHGGHGGIEAEKHITLGRAIENNGDMRGARLRQGLEQAAEKAGKADPPAATSRRGMTK